MRLKGVRVATGKSILAMSFNGISLTVSIIHLFFFILKIHIQLVTLDFRCVLKEFKKRTNFFDTI